jgi:NTE family protein
MLSGGSLANRRAMSEAGRKHAIILSGGGAYGAYEVGVLKALLAGKSPTTNYEPLVPTIFTGTSVGAYNSTFMVARLAAGGAKAAADLEQVWKERIASRSGTSGNGVFRIRFNPAEYAQPAYRMDPLRPLITAAYDTAYFSAQLLVRTVSATLSEGALPLRALQEIDLSAALDASPFHELIRDTIDFEDVYRSPIALNITATAWETGLPRHFKNTSRTVTARAVQASASIPVVFPPTILDGEPFFDGGLSMNTPLTPAMEAGAEVIHIVFLDPQVRAIPMRWPISTAAEVYRILAILFASQTRAQIVEISQWSHGRRRPTVYVYRPSHEVLEGLRGFIKFERSYIGKLIETGYQDAVNHSGKPVVSASTPLDLSLLRS